MITGITIIIIIIIIIIIWLIMQHDTIKKLNWIELNF
jgi:hypothetical protein